jgi:succinate dehydrogenase/fumarate reductase flavoprotein subunit
MWKNAGIIRDGDGLQSALKEISAMQKTLVTAEKKGINADIIEIRNMLLVSKLIVSAALAREESRGAHYRDDYPEKADEWERHITLSRVGKHNSL